MQARNNAQQGNNPQHGAASQPADGPQPGGAGAGGEAGAAQGGAQGGVSVTGVESNSTSCAICISEYALDEDVRLLPCSHYFHASVRFVWLGGFGGRVVLYDMSYILCVRVSSFRRL